MVKVDLEKLAEFEARATPGPWGYESERYSALCVIGVKPADDRWIAHCQPAFNGKANGLLIAETRNALPALIAELRAAREVCRHLRRFREDWYVTPTPAMDALAAYDAATGEKP